MADTNSAVLSTIGPEMMKKIEESKILLVGAGGIGCELLKNLALTGFRHVQVIDLDTIDVSNLNRQLLFRSHHVGMPKCQIACQVASTMVDDPSLIQYNFHHGNVCETETFNVQYVERFDLVLNALDNVVARRRVNRLCLAAHVPLVEAGTMGYLGQVNVIDKESNIACYECETQETQKVYPICTIRSTPSMPVHTIVWAKELYKLLFHETPQESMLFEDTSTGEPSTYMESVMTYRALVAGGATTDPLVVREAAQAILTKVYVEEIQKQLDMERYKTAQKTPAPLGSIVIVSGMKHMPPTERDTGKSTDVWTLSDCVAEFGACLMDAVADPAVLLPTFDKDDRLGMRLVTCASNLRNYVFGIHVQSLYSAKGIAGNIIPAIATTNAICAGIQILQALHILQMQLDHDSKNGHLGEYCSYVNCLRNSTRNGLLLTAAALEKPNPHCYVCRHASIPLALNTNKWTLELLLERIVKKELGFAEPTLLLEGDIIWEEGAEADSDAFRGNLVKPLDKLPAGGIVNGTVLRIEDFSQDLSANIAFAHQNEWLKPEDEQEAEENDDFRYDLQGAATPTVASSAESKPAAVEMPTMVASRPENDDDDDGDDIVEVTDDKENGHAKRPYDEISNGASPFAKRLKTPETAEDDVIEIE